MENPNEPVSVLWKLFLLTCANTIFGQRSFIRWTCQLFQWFAFILSISSFTSYKLAGYLDDRRMTGFQNALFILCVKFVE